MAKFQPCRSWGLAAALALFVGGQASPVAAQAPPAAPSAKKSVSGKLESLDKQLNGLIMRSDDNRRLAWQFDRSVIAEVGKFAKPGDAIIVIYRQISPNEKRVTAIAFPGTAKTPIYVNLTGERVVLRSAPMVDGACNPNPDAVQETMIPAQGRAEIAEACWCCASADEKACRPGNKTGLGQALLVKCFE